MSNLKSRILMFIATICMVSLFAFPLWRITLSAPQYPEGISMYIWINKITGDTDYTIQNINILNHYVGMKNIEPEMFPELEYFPIVVGLLAGLGLLFTIINKPSLFLTWLIIVIVLGALGMYDFYLWEYDYGHNLSDTAPIKVPGMAYQPPLFGTKMLLNFKADSYPGYGGIAYGAAAIFAFFAFISSKAAVRKLSVSVGAIVSFTLFSSILFSSCSTEPQKIAFGKDACTHCRMVIADQRYGGELISKKGKVFKFDATECLIRSLNEDLLTSKEIHSILLIDFLRPGEFIPADKSYIVRSPRLPSPMGMYLTSVENKLLAESLKLETGDLVFSWQELLSNFDNLPPININEAHK